MRSVIHPPSCRRMRSGISAWHRLAMSGAVALLLAPSAWSQSHQDIHLANGQLLRLPIAMIDSMGFYPAGYATPPVLTTLPVSAVTSIAAVGGGTVSATALDARGLCWADHPDPTVADMVGNAAPGIGAFQVALSGLQGGTTYYVRSFATNPAGTFYGNEVSFTTDTALFQVGGGATDQNGNTYSTVIIAGEEWMAENLRAVNFANGDPIPQITNGTSWYNLSTPAYCRYNNSNANDLLYGKLYNGYVAIDPRNACPTGWHVGTHAEMLAMVEALDTVIGISTISSRAGAWLKSTGSTYWTNPNFGATNETGFSARAGGSRFPNGNFSSITLDSRFWTSTLLGVDQLWSWGLEYDTAEVSDGFGPEMRLGNSIRCVRD